MEKRRFYREEKHPHVRGEDTLWRLETAMNLETPPRAWGRRSRRGCAHDPHGNTPTCVGKTRWSNSTHPRGKKHPHVRGEDIPPPARAPPATETPPRAWGRQYQNDAQEVHGRNTPTCVGKTLRDYSLFLLSRQNNIETSSFSDTSCSPDNSMSWRFGSPMP